MASFAIPRRIIALFVGSVIAIMTYARSDAAENTAPPTNLSSPVQADSLESVFQRALIDDESAQQLDVAIQGYQRVIAGLDAHRAMQATALFRLGECYRRQGKTDEAAAQYERILRDFSEQTNLVTLSRRDLELLGRGSGDAATPKLTNAARSEQVRLLKEEMAMLDKQLEAHRLMRENGKGDPENYLKDQRDQLRLKRQIALLVNGPQAAQEQEGFLKDEIGLVERKLADQKRAYENGALSQGDLWRTQRELLDLKRQLVALNAVPAETAAVSGGEDALNSPAGTEQREIDRWKAVLRPSPDLINATSGDGEMPLASASGKGQLLLTQYLLDHGARITPRALNLAAQNGHKSMVDLLLDRGAPVDSQWTGGETALHQAVRRGFVAVAETLLAHKADVNAKDIKGRTPLHSAVDNLSNAEMIQLLLSNGADPNIADQEGRTPFFGVISNLELMQKFLDHGANVNAHLSSGDTPLIAATTAGKEEAVEWLLEHGAETGARRTSSGETALHIAVAGDQKAIVSILLNHGADPNARDAKGNTPLHDLIEGGSLECGELLLTHHADPSIRNDLGMTPLESLRDFAGTGSTRSVNRIRPIAGRFGGFVRSTSAPSSDARLSALEALLIRHGAVEDLPRLDRIEVRRPDTAYQSAAFLRGTQDFNHFTLFEIIALRWGLVSDDRSRSQAIKNLSQKKNPARLKDVEYPDFSRVVLRHPSADGLHWESRELDLSLAFKTGDCSVDLLLSWGDVIEIPEKDHVLNEPWPGLDDAVLITLKKCLARQVTVVVKGKATQITLEPNMGIEEGKVYWVDGYVPFMLVPVLYGSKALLMSSDLSRLRVQRTHPLTGAPTEWRVDASERSDPPNLWLRDGDLIEVPEKP